MKKKRILVVEDDPPSLAALKHILERHGLDVAAARSGEGALLAIAAEKPDLVALDLKLAGSMSGYDVLERLKKDPAGAKLPVVIISNFGLQQEVERGRAYGVADYLVKSDHSIHEIADRIAQFV